MNFCPARIPDIRRIVVPEFPQLRVMSPLFGKYFPSDFTIIEFSLCSISAPSALQISRLESGSLPLEKFLITDCPFAIEAKIIALWEIDLSAGIVISPFRGF